MILYKFTSLEGDRLLYALDMIVNKRVYLAKSDSTNDPYEGGWVWDGPILQQEDFLQKYEKLRRIVDSVRFTCFTDACNNELLWAHYAGGFKGVCYQYKIDEDKYDIRRIKYDGRAKITEEQIENIIDRKLSPQDIGILNSKSKCWEYESEYRLYQNNCNSDPYIHVSPSKIIFGARGLKYDDVLLAIAKKYRIAVEYLLNEGDNHVTVS